MYCEKCGQQISDNAKFCRFCGGEVIPELSEISEYQRKVEERQRIRDEHQKNTQNASRGYVDEYDYDEGSEYENNHHYRVVNTAAALDGIGRAKETAGHYFEEIKGIAGKAAEKTRGIRINKKAIALILAAVVVAAASFAIISANRNTIKLDKYLEIEVVGIDGDGYVRSEIDWDKLVSENKNRIKTTDMYRSSQSFYDVTEMDIFSWYVSLNVDNTLDLKNGDEVNYSWDISDELYDYFDVKLKHKDGKIKVTGLKVLEEIDPFDHLQVSFVGSDGDGELFLETDEFLRDRAVVFTTDKDMYLSNGDEIRVYFSMEDNSLENEGYVASTYMKTYIVSGLQENMPVVTEAPAIYSGEEGNTEIPLNDDEVQADTEVPLDDYVEETYSKATNGIGNPKTIYEIPENIKNDLRRAAEEKIRQNVDQTWASNEYLDRTEYVGQYLVTRTDVNNIGDNQIGVVFKNYVSILKDGWTPHGVEYYYVLVFRNLYIKENGEYTYDKPFEPENSVYAYPPSGGTFYYTGFEDLAGLKTFLVDPLLKRYQYSSDY